MKYRVYLYAYEYGWEKYICKEKTEVKDVIDNLDPYDYGQYIIIKELPDRDEVYDTGFIAKPHAKKLKPSKKH